MDQLQLFALDQPTKPTFARDSTISSDGYFCCWIRGKWVKVAKARTGFPPVCPIVLADPVNAANCEPCPYYCQVRHRWSCAHGNYQQAPETHFCRFCGAEICPYGQARGWHYCHDDRCDRKDL